MTDKIVEKQEKSEFGIVSNQLEIEREERKRTKRCDMCGEITELAKLQKSNTYSDLEYCATCFIYAQQWDQEKKPRYERVIKDAVERNNNNSEGGWRNDDYTY